MKLTAINTNGATSSHTASDAVFGFGVNKPLLAQAIRVYMANEHQSTSRVKTRAEVKRTKKKWYKQKGTGNARHAARSAPIFVGGGVAHGPKGLSTAKLNLSQQQKHQALKSALSLQTESIIVSEGIEGLKGKTSEAQKVLLAILGAEVRTLIVLSNRNEKVERSMANIQSALVTTAESVTALDVCSADKIIFSPEAITALETRINSAKSAKTKTAKPAKTAKATKTEKPATKTKVTAKKTPAKPAVKTKAAVVEKVAKKSTKSTTAKK